MSSSCSSPIFNKFNMASEVEGDWKNFTIRIIQPNDMNQVADFVQQNFFLTDIVYKLGGYSTCSGEDWLYENLQLLNIVEQGFSLLVEETESHEIAAVWMATEENRNHSNLNNAFHQLQSTPQKRLQIIFNKLAEDSYNVLEEFNVDSYMKYMFACVDPRFHGEGIAFEMFKRSIKLASLHGHAFIAGTFTNPYMRKIATKLGFQEVCRLYMADLKDKNKNTIFSTVGRNDFVVFMISHELTDVVAFTY